MLEEPGIVKASPDQLANLLASLGTDAWRLTPATLAAKLSKGKWVAAKHLLYISTIISSAIAQGNARIIVSMPPRHGKSELISHWLPVWVLDRWPLWNIILTSYGAELSSHFARRVRDEIEYQNKEGEKLRCHLGNITRADSFNTTEGGGLLSAGVAGPITGRGANVLLIDDYLRNAKDAASMQIRQDQWDWFISTSNTRLEPGGSIVICATRWNRDDIIGRILEMIESGDFSRLEEADPDAKLRNWIYIKLPALALDSDPLGREFGEVLWKERYDIERLMEIQITMGGEGAYFWAALFQQDPIPRVAGQVTKEMFKYVDSLPHYSRLRKIRAWDLAGSQDKGDFTSGTGMAIDKIDGKVYVFDQERQQVGPKKLEKLLTRTADMDGTETPIWIEQEPGSAGKITAEYLVFKVLKGYAAKAEKSTGDKFVRAQPLMSCIQSENLYLLRAPWNKKFIEEFCTFPDGMHDDQVDSSSLAYSKLIGKRLKGVTWGRRPTPDNKTIEGVSTRVEDVIIRPSNKAAFILGPTWRPRG